MTSVLHFRGTVDDVLVVSTSWKALPEDWNCRRAACKRERAMAGVSASARCASLEGIVSFVDLATDRWETR